MNDQHDRLPSSGVEQEPQPEQPREPSMNEVAARISDQLLVTEEAQRMHIRRIVWELGRTQALALCAEVVEQTDQSNQAIVDQYLVLVAEKGVKKDRPWLRPQREQVPSKPAPVSEVARLIAEQLGESEATVQGTIYRSVRTLGVETALAYLQRTQEIEAAGGLMLPDGSRKRTPGGVYFWLIRKRRRQSSGERFSGLLEHAPHLNQNSLRSHLKLLLKKCV